MADNEDDDDDDKDNGDMETQGDGDHRSAPCDPAEGGQLGGKVIFVVDFVAHLQIANDHCLVWRLQHLPLGDNTFFLHLVDQEQNIIQNMILIRKEGKKYKLLLNSDSSELDVISFIFQGR